MCVKQIERGQRDTDNICMYIEEREKETGGDINKQKDTERYRKIQKFTERYSRYRKRQKVRKK